MKIAILGGGVAGLATAFQLQREHDVTCFEARDIPGGNIRTTDLDGCRVEWGPNGWLDNEPATMQLVDELGLTPRLARARDAAARRFIWRAGKLRELPKKPAQFLTSDVLPLFARLRAACEPFGRKPPGGDESVFDFAARRLGRGAASVLVDAFVTGVFAGDPKRLSVQSAFPRLKKLEAEYGSLIKGAKGRGFGPPGTLTSFDRGLSVLTNTLAERIDLRCGEAWKTFDAGAYDRVVCALPAPRAAALATGELAAALAEIPTAPVAVVALAFDEPLDVPDAFGFLVPRGHGLRILGALYDSSIFPGRAPSGRRLFRIMIGGRRDPDAVALDDEALLEIAAADLQRAWGTWKRPVASQVIRHPLGIAQYEIGHAERVERIEAAAPPHLHFIGSSYRGVAINACVKEALEYGA